MAEPIADMTLRFIESARMHLVAASLELVECDLAGPATLARALSASVPDNWPPELYDRPAMEHARQELMASGGNGWSFWYLVDKVVDARELVGICGFKGRPGQTGSVEISYSILRQHRSKGVATEAVGRLVEWAFTHSGVHEVRAETLPHLRQSIRVLEKNGFQLTGPGSEHGVVRYAVRRSRHR